MAGLSQPREQFLRGTDMARLGGADEIVVRDVDELEGVLEALGDVRDKLVGIATGGFKGTGGIKGTGGTGAGGSGFAGSSADRILLEFLSCSSN